MRERANLALFDFDGTITDRDTFVPFLRYAAGGQRLLWGTLFIAPMLLGYHLGVVSATRMRAASAFACFRGRTADSVENLGRQYVETLSSAIRSSARERLAWHRQNGDRVVVVSASLDVYLRPWCEAEGFDLVCTELESRNGILAGRYRGGDCTGDEKARRVRAFYALDEYTSVYAYGDTEEDRALLGLASKAYFRGRQIRA